jgi:DNA invertase Pin-like site-specific DNA recombinase
MGKERAITIGRCSTNKYRQDVTRQTYDLSETYDNMFDILKCFEYYKSGKKNEIENYEIIKYAIDNNIQHIIVTEVSRISRTLIGINIFRDLCHANNINIIVDDLKLSTLNYDKSINLNASVRVTSEALYAEREISLFMSRIKSGLDKYTQDGGKVGRKEGYTKPISTFLSEHSDVVGCLEQGISIRKISKITCKSPGTVVRVKKVLQSINIVE